MVQLSHPYIHDYWRNMKVWYFRSDFTEEEAQEVKIVPLQHRERGGGNPDPDPLHHHHHPSRACPDLVST